MFNRTIHVLAAWSAMAMTGWTAEPRQVPPADVNATSIGSDAEAWAAARAGSIPLTLDAAIQLALENNPELRAAAGRVEAAAGRADQARPRPNPELEFGIEEWPVGGGGGYSEAKQTLGVAQTLPFPGKKPLDRRIGSAAVKVSEAQRGLLTRELVRDVKVAFFRVLAAERLMEVAAELVKVADSSAATAARRVEAGAVAFQEQLRAEIQSEQVKSELTGLRCDLVTARQGLAMVMGRPDLQDAPLSGAMMETPAAGLRDEAAQVDLSTYPGMAAAQATLDQATLEHRRARLEPYPDLRVGVAGGRMGDTGDSIVELRVALPLPLFDRAKGRRKESQANVVVARAEMDVVRQQLLRQRADTVQRYLAAIEQVTLYREQILPKAAEALRLVQTGFEQGKFNFIDWVDTQRTVAEARLAYQQRLLEMNVAQAELEAFVIAGPSTIHPQTGAKP